MNAIHRVVGAGLVLAGLSACASTGNTLAQRNAVQVPAAAPAAAERIVVDSEYVATVEHIAVRRGVEVRWVNPPLRRVASR